MNIEAWPMHGPLNSKTVFAKFIKSMEATGDKVHVNKQIEGDIAEVIGTAVVIEALDKAGLT